MHPGESQRKSDTIDAVAAARAVQAGQALGVPKSTDGDVEAIRLLRIARRGAMRARTQAALKLRNILDTAPESLRASMSGLDTRALAVRAARLRPGPLVGPMDAAKRALVLIARRWPFADDEIRVLDADLAELAAVTAPALIALPVSAQTRPERCSSPPATTQIGYPLTRRSPRSAV